MIEFRTRPPARGSGGLAVAPTTATLPRPRAVLLMLRRHSRLATVARGWHRRPNPRAQYRRSMESRGCAGRVCSFVAVCARPKPLENDLVREARSALAVVFSANRPCQQRQREHAPCQQGCWGRQVLDVIGKKMRPPADSMKEICEFACGAIPALGAVIPVLRAPI